MNDLRAYADSLGFSWPSEESHGPRGLLFWEAITGYVAPPWYSGSSGVFQLPATDKSPMSYFRLLTTYLAGRTAPVFVVFAQAVLEQEGRCPELLTAEAARLLATEVQVVSDEELSQRILRRNFIQQPG